MKRLIFVFHDSNIKSGATAALLDILIKLLKEKKFNDLIKSYAVIPSAPNNIILNNILTDLGMEVFVSKITMTRINYNAPHYYKLASYLYSLIKISKCYFYSRSLAKSTGVNFDLIYTNTSSSYFGIFLAKHLHCKHILHCREFGIEDQNMKQVFGEKNFWSFVLKYTDSVITISRSLEKKLLEYIPKENLHLIYDDVSVESVGRKDVSFCNGNQVNVLLAGTICKGKGQEFVIDSLDYIRKNNNLDIHLNIAGSTSSPYAKYLMNKVNKKNNDGWVNFLGHCENMGSIRSSNDVAIISSSSEAFGRVTIEAMSSNLFVIASDRGANPELVDDKKTGLIYEHGSIESLENAIIYFFENPARAEEIAEKGNEFSKNYTNDRSARKVNKLITTTLGI